MEMWTAAADQTNSCIGTLYAAERCCWTSVICCLFFQISSPPFLFDNIKQQPLVVRRVIPCTLSTATAPPPFNSDVLMADLSRRSCKCCRSTWNEQCQSIWNWRPVSAHTKPERSVVNVPVDFVPINNNKKLDRTGDHNRGWWRWWFRASLHAFLER